MSRCRTSEFDYVEVKRLIDEGLSFKEIGLRTGRHRGTIRRICRRFGWKSKWTITEKERDKLRQNAVSRFAIDWKQRVDEKTNGRFLFVDIVEYRKGEAVLQIRCSACGEARRASSITLRHQNSNIGLRCKKCEETEKKKKEEQKQHEQQQRELQRFINKKRVQVQMPFCKCGQLLKNGQQRCDECKRQTARAFEKRRELKRQKRIKNFGCIDKDITLERLYDRDAGVCYICGCSCSWNDYTRNDKGAFVVGATYPTIEHVKPLSKGGGHVWENVRLACWTCNTQKGDKELAAV